MAHRQCVPNREAAAGVDAYIEHPTGRAEVDRRVVQLWDAGLQVTVRFSE